MIELSLTEIADLVGGVVADAGEREVRRVTGSVEFDSRRVGAGDLFVAVAGERVDGHDFAAAAVAAGAAGVLANRAVGVPAVVVADPVAAMAELARAVLARLPRLRVIGVTGSSGKTSTKDLLHTVLRRLGPTIAPPGSFNNELGHPHTVLRADADTRYLVLEKSARGVGHIAALCRIAPPDIGVVLNVGSAHLGEFGSVAAIAQAKGELVEAVSASGVAVLNGDDPLVAAMTTRTRARVVRFGEHGAQVTAEQVLLDPAGRASYTLRCPAGSAPVRLRLHGRHHVANSLAAAAVALELGMGVAEVATALSEATADSRWRMEVSRRGDGLTVVNDAYNANPESMRAALETVAAMAARRRWAVLGAMGELGEAAGQRHREVGRYAAELGFDHVITVGALAAEIGAGAAGGATRVSAVADAAAALSLLAAAQRDAELGDGDVVVVKASRFVGLERVAIELLAGAAGEGQQA